MHFAGSGTRRVLLAARAGLGRAPVAVASNAWGISRSTRVAASPPEVRDTKAARPLTVPAHQPFDGRRGRSAGTGRRTAAAAKGKKFQERRRRQESDTPFTRPRFQQFGRAGGEGSKVAQGLYEDFGIRSLQEYSPEAVEKRKGVLEWMEEVLGMRARAIADMAEQEPRIGEQETESIAERLAWLRSRLRLSDEQIKSLVHRRPSILCRSMDGMEAKVQWLQEELSLTDNEVATMMSSAPNILTVSIEGSMTPKLGWLTRHLSLSKEQLAMVVTTCPQVLTSSVEGALEPRLSWLRDNLRIGEAVLRERVLMHPWLLNLSVKDKLAPTYDFLKTEVVLDEAEIRKTLFRNPRMFLTPMRKTMDSTVQWLCQTVGMEEEEALKVVAKDVRLLLRSTEVLDSKVAFFCKEMDATLGDVRAVLHTSPNLLLVSVDHVLAPRVEALKAIGVKVSFSLHWNQLAFCPSGDAFDDWVFRVAARRSPRG